MDKNEDKTVKKTAKSKTKSASISPKKKKEKVESKNVFPDIKEEKKEKEEEKDLFYHFEIHVNKEIIGKEIELLANKYAMQVKVPGFRQGKVPIDIVKVNYQQSLSEEVTQKLINKFCLEKIDQEKLEIVTDPVVEKIDYVPGQDLKAKIVVETYPVIDLPELEKLEIEIPKNELQVKDYMESEQIDLILERNKKQVPVSGRSIIDNDVVVLLSQFKPLDTKKMSPQNRNYYRVHPDENYDIKDLYKEIVGKKEKDPVVFKRKYPDNYSRKVWAGKEIEHHIIIEKAFALIKPELDRDLLQKLGFANEGDLKNKLTEEYEKYRNNHIRQKKLEYIYRKLSEILHFPVPKTLIHREFLRKGSQDTYLLDLPEEERKSYAKTIHQKAEEEVKTYLIYHALKKKYQIQTTHEDLENEYQRIADINKLKIKEVKQYYRQEKKEDELKNHIELNKFEVVLLEKINIKEV